MGGGRRLRRRPLARRSPRWTTRRGAHQRPYRARTPGFLLAHLVGREPLRLGVEVPELVREFLVGAAALVGLGVFAAVPGGHRDALVGDVDGLQEVVEAVALLPGEDAGDLVAVVQGPHRLRACGVALGEGHAHEHKAALPFPPLSPAGFLRSYPGTGFRRSRERAIPPPRFMRGPARRPASPPAARGSRSAPSSTSPVAPPPRGTRSRPRAFGCSCWPPARSRL